MRTLLYPCPAFVFELPPLHQFHFHLTSGVAKPEDLQAKLSTAWRSRNLSSTLLRANSLHLHLLLLRFMSVASVHASTRGGARGNEVDVILVDDWEEVEGSSAASSSSRLPQTASRRPEKRTERLLPGGMPRCHPQAAPRSPRQEPVPPQVGKHVSEPLRPP